MFLRTIQVGNSSLTKDELKKDKKNCEKIGPCGIGELAIYTNSYFIDRRYYIKNYDIRRIFKRIAMSKNGFTGRGAFATLSYLVVELSNGVEKQYNFKYEQEVDNFISKFHLKHPEIPIYSVEAEKKLEEERLKEEARYLKNLSEKANESIKELNDTKDFLKKNEEVCVDLTNMARQKRIIDQINPAYKFFAIALILISFLLFFLAFNSIKSNQGFSTYFVIFGFIIIVYAVSLQVLPTARNNRRFANREFNKALEKAKSTFSNYNNFPIPYQYGTIYTINRMIRMIREGKAETIKDAYEYMKNQLKEINKTWVVTQDEYDEIVAIKPLFMMFDYKDEFKTF